MDARQWAEFKPLLAEAMGRPVDQRRAFITDRCVDSVVCRELVSIAE